MNVAIFLKFKEPKAYDESNNNNVNRNNCMRLNLTNSLLINKAMNYLYNEL